jgi:hypothetical protein
MIDAMEEALSYLVMEILTKVSIKMVRPMERGFTPGLMEKYLMENGWMDKNVAMVYGEE